MSGLWSMASSCGSMGGVVQGAPDAGDTHSTLGTQLELQLAPACGSGRKRCPGRVSEAGQEGTSVAGAHSR